MPSSRFLRERADADGVITARADLKVGAQVEVARGPFDGLIGIITRPPDAKGRVKVLMQLVESTAGSGGRPSPLVARRLGRLSA